MHLGRTILILLVALSVAMLPATGGAATSAKPADMSMSSSVEDMSASMDDMHDCCPHKKLPSEKAIDDCCSSMATCSMNCFAFAGIFFLDRFPVAAGQRTRAFGEQSIALPNGQSSLPTSSRLTFLNCKR